MNATSTLLTRLSLLVAAGALLGACATNQGASAATKEKPKAGRFIVAAKKSPFYKYGPAQAFGPDFALPQGQKLTLIEQSFGFSRVMTDDGLAGYMPTEDLIPAVGEPLPQPAAPRMASRRPASTSPALYTGPVRKSRPVERMEDAPPLFDVFDVPLPSNPEPTVTTQDTKAKPAVKPKFRTGSLAPLQ